MNLQFFSNEPLNFSWRSFNPEKSASAHLKRDMSRVGFGRSFSGVSATARSTGNSTGSGAGFDEVRSEK